jgi:peptidoglycan hydrolase-like protein with peptidoglycan-binding domain
MKLHIAVAAAALSIAGGVFAAGNQAPTTSGSTSSDQTTTSSQQQGSKAMGSTSTEQSNPTLVRSAQQALKQKGYDVGSIDGQLGPSTESALRQFQEKEGLPRSGNLDQETLSKLGVNENQGSMEGQGSMQSPSSGSQGATQSQGNAGSTGMTQPNSNNASSSSYKQR